MFYTLFVTNLQSGNEIREKSTDDESSSGYQVLNKTDCRLAKAFIVLRIESSRSHTIDTFKSSLSSCATR